jgi:hypothetical protein
MVDAFTDTPRKQNQCPYIGLKSTLLWSFTLIQKHKSPCDDNKWNAGFSQTKL